MVQTGLGKNTKPYLKKNYSRKGWECDWVVEHLPRKCKTLTSKISASPHIKKPKPKRSKEPGAEVHATY
jgi:hypothetical protein